MIETIEGLPAGVVGVRASGKVTKEDYERVLDPLFARAHAEGGRLRFLYQLGPELEGFSAGAALEDARLGLSSFGILEGVAVVTDVGWVRDAVRLFRFAMPRPVAVYANRELAAAAAWLAALPERATVDARMVAERGVLVVEIRESPLSAADFDAVAELADGWIGARGRLPGLVLHARAFPGWENLGGLVRHARFVRDHHRRIDRIALAVEGPLAALVPRVAEHFVAAELRRFGYDELDAAIAWAGGDAAKT